jgi:hypothetical protein
MARMLSVSVEVEELEDGIVFCEAVLGIGHAAVLTWAPGAGSAFFELADGVRLIVSSPPRSSDRPEWLGLELEVSDPVSEHDRLEALGIAVSDVYTTDGGSAAFVVTAANGQKLRIGTRWDLPVQNADLSGGPGPKERGLQ